MFRNTIVAGILAGAVFTAAASAQRIVPVAPTSQSLGAEQPRLFSRIAVLFQSNSSLPLDAALRSSLIDYLSQVLGVDVADVEQGQRGARAVRLTEPVDAVESKRLIGGYSDVPGIGRIRVTYQRMSSRKGKFRHWFWTPRSAEIEK